MRRGLLLAFPVSVAALALVLLEAGGDEQPVAVVGHRGASSLPSTTAATPVTQPAAPPTTKAAAVAVANRSSTVVRPGGNGVTVVNDGSAIASTGGNMVMGTPDGATVVNGPATAVGNSADVRITPP